MTDSTQRELRMLANRMLTQTEARNGYQGSPVCLLLRKDAEKAMALMTKAADLVDVLESSLRLQAEVAADANAQANTMRRLLGEALEVMECNDPRQPMLGRMRAALGNAPAPVPAQPVAAPEASHPDCNYSGRLGQLCMKCGNRHTVVPPNYSRATLPLEIAGSLLPDDYVSPRLAAEAYRENEPDAGNDDDDLEAVAACLEDDAAIVREVDGYEEVPANMEKAASIIRRFAAQQNREKGQ